MGRTHVAQAAATDNVFGEAYSDDVGFVSFNNCTSPSSCSGVSYGVKVDPTTGNLSGAAWSSALGWISFNANSTTGCTTQPKVNLVTGAFSGFAWAQNAYGDGWNGCIALSAADIGQSGWGWQANTTTGAVTGAAWGDKLNVGWLVPQSDMLILSSVFAPSTYTITASSGANGTVTPAGVATVAKNANKTYTITPSAGYNIASVLVDGSSVGTSSIYTFTNVIANHTISATFSLPPGCGAPTYNITATYGPGGVVAPGGTTAVACTGSKTYTITPNAGYTIAAVKIDGSNIVPTNTFTFTNVTSNHTINATFASNPANGPYTITSFAGPNGTIAPLGSTTVAKGGSQSYTITPNATYTITNITVDGVSLGAGSSFTFSNVQANHTISAAFSSCGGVCPTIPATPPGHPTNGGIIYTEH